MFARVTKVQVFKEKRPFEPATVDEALAMWKDKVAHVKAAQKGFAEALFLMNQDHRTVMTVTLWETEDDLRSVEASGLYSTLLNAFSDVPAQKPVKEYYQVGAAFRAKWSTRAETGRS